MTFVKNFSAKVTSIKVKEVKQRRVWGHAKSCNADHVWRKGRIKCSPVPLIHVASMTKSTSPFSFGGFILNRKSSCSLRALLAVWVWSKLAEFWHSATKATKALSLLLDSDVWLVLKASWCKTGTIFTNCRELQTFSTTKNGWFSTIRILFTRVGCPADPLCVCQEDFHRFHFFGDGWQIGRYGH